MSVNWDFMKVASAPESFDLGSDYLYEIKWDGIRCMTVIGGGKVQLFSKDKVNITNRFPEVAQAMLKFKNQDLIIDGELVVLQANGKPEFLDVMHRFNATRPNTVRQLSISLKAKYICFDILSLNEENVTTLAIEPRKELLKQVTAELDTNRVQFNVDFGDGRQLFKKVTELNLEGIVAKGKGSIYKQGSQSNNWLKVDNRIMHECEVVEVINSNDKTIIGIEEKGIFRGYVEHGITSDNYEQLKTGMMVKVEHGMTSKNGHYREPYLTGLET